MKTMKQNAKQSMRKTVGRLIGAVAIGTLALTTMSAQAMEKSAIDYTVDSSLSSNDHTAHVVPVGLSLGFKLGHHRGFGHRGYGKSFRGKKRFNRSGFHHRKHFNGYYGASRKGFKSFNGRGKSSFRNRRNFKAGQYRLCCPARYLIAVNNSSAN